MDSHFWIARLNDVNQHSIDIKAAGAAWLGFTLTINIIGYTLNFSSDLKLLVRYHQFLFELKYFALELNILTAEFEHLLVKLSDPLNEFWAGELPSQFYHLKRVLYDPQASAS